MNCEEFVVSLLQECQRINYELKEENDKLQKENNMMKELINRLTQNAEAYTYPNGDWELEISSSSENVRKMNKLFKELNIRNPFTS